MYQDFYTVKKKSKSVGSSRVEYERQVRLRGKGCAWCLHAYMSPYARYLPSRNRRRGKEGEKNLIGVQYMCATFTIFANTGREVGIRNLCPSPLSANRLAENEGQALLFG